MASREAPYCNFCSCDICTFGRSWLPRAKTCDGRWICEVCYLCLLFEDETKPTLATEFVKPC